MAVVEKTLGVSLLSFAVVVSLYISLLALQDACEVRGSYSSVKEIFSSVCPMLVVNEEFVAFQAFLKAIPIWICAGAAINAKFVMFGLFLSSLGDIFLESLMLFPVGNDNHDIIFIAGLGSFLVAHIFYVVHNLRGIMRLSFRRLLLSSPPMIIYAYKFCGILLPHVSDDLLIPIVFYSSVIAAMGISSVLNGEPLGIVGALWFILSDSILSYNKFVSPIPYGKYAVMFTYYTAQYFIASSAAACSKPRKTDKVE